MPLRRGPFYLGEIAVGVHTCIGLLNAGNISIVTLLLDADPSLVNVQDKTGETPLHQAAIHGWEDIVSLLLEKGANANAAKNNGWTALNFASQEGHEDVAIQLLQGGAKHNKVD